jgi:hypothetical protein
MTRMRLLLRSTIWAMVAVASVTPAMAASPDTRPSVPPTDAPVVVTMEVVDETFRVLLTHPDDVAIAWQLAAGEEAPSIPNGRIVYGDGGVNAPWTWHLDPDDFEWADITTEVCDAKPSDVELHIITSDRYCPWLAPVLSVEPVAPDGSPPPVAGFPRFRDTMTPAWTMLDALRTAIAGPASRDLELIAQVGPAVADALEAGLGSVLPDICYLDAWRLQWLVAVDLRLVADLWSGGNELYADAAGDRLVTDLAMADEALATIGCD